MIVEVGAYGSGRDPGLDILQIGSAGQGTGRRSRCDEKCWVKSAIYNFEKISVVPTGLVSPKLSEGRS